MLHDVLERGVDRRSGILIDRAAAAAVHLKFNIDRSTATGKPQVIDYHVEFQMRMGIPVGNGDIGRGPALRSDLTPILLWLDGKPLRRSTRGCTQAEVGVAVVVEPAFITAEVSPPRIKIRV